MTWWDWTTARGVTAGMAVTETKRAKAATREKRDIVVRRLYTNDPSRRLGSGLPERVAHV